ncbi:Interferon- developmental regulator 1, partial [Homalodisca vitripennis]
DVTSRESNGEITFLVAMPCWSWLPTSMSAYTDCQIYNIQVRFGLETLALDSWCRKKQYDAFCQVLGSGMNLNLTENDLLRDVFELGEKLVPLNMAAHKQSRIERHLMNQANFKARCISRAKNRDKRSAVIS